MPVNAKCLCCEQGFLVNTNPVISNESKFQVCPKCGQAYYVMDGDVDNITVKNCMVDNRGMANQFKKKD